MAVGIKKDLQAWSEDYFPPSNKPFSNVQTLSIKINKEEIRKVDNQISLVIRCTHKTDLDKAFFDFLTQKSHDFSIALEISERKNTELKEYSLYDELMTFNDLVAVGELMTDVDLDIDLE